MPTKFQINHFRFKLSLIACGLSLLIMVSSSFGQESMPAPTIDIDAIVNDNLNFLKNREPEMTDAEYALYQKVVPLVLKRPEFALTLLETMLLDDEPESPAFSYVLANIYYAQESFDQAESYYKRAIDDFPNFLRAWINLGILYFRQEQYNAAIPCFTKAIELGNTEAEIRGLLGYCLIKNRRPIAAEATYLQALSIEPQNSDWIEALASLYLESEQYNRAEPMIRALIEQNSKKMLNRRLLVSLMISEDREAEAITELEIARVMGISTPADDLQLAGLCAKNLLYAEAYQIFETLAPNHTDLIANQLFSYVESLISKADFAKAQQLLSVFKGTLSPDATIRRLYLIAKIQKDTEEYSEALKTLRALFKLDPLYGPALMTAAVIHKDREEYTHAAQYFSQAQPIEDHTYIASIELANIALKKNDYREALKQLENALRIESTPELQTFKASILAILSTRNDN